MRNVRVSRYLVPVTIASLVCVTGVQAYLLYRLSAGDGAQGPTEDASEASSTPWLRVRTTERPPLLSEDPFAEFDEMQRRIDAMFNRAMSSVSEASQGFPKPAFRPWPDASDLFTGPAMTFQDRGDRYEVTMPIDEGANPEVQVQLDGRDLAIEVVLSEHAANAAPSGAGRSPNKVECSRRLSQSVRLPQPVDESSLEVTTEDGLLRVTIEKRR